MTDQPELTPLMRLWELENGRNLREAITEAINETGSTERASVVMGVPYRTLDKWARRLKIRRVRVALVRPPVVAPAAATEAVNAQLEAAG